MAKISTLLGGLACAIAVLAPPPARSATAQDPGRGAAIYKGKGNCVSCHGPAAKGTPLAPDLTDGEWVNFERRPTLTEVEALVRTGVAKPVRHPAPMPPMGGARLSDEEVASVAAYVLSLSSEPGSRLQTMVLVVTS